MFRHWLHTISRIVISNSFEIGNNNAGTYGLFVLAVQINN